MGLLAAWLLFPLLLCLTFLGWGLVVERLSGRDLPGVLLLPMGLAAVLVVARVLVAAQFLVDIALPLIVLVALVGLFLGRERLRALRFDPWAAAAAFGVFLMVAAPAVFSGEPTFTGSLVLGDTAHQLTLADRLGEAGSHSQPLPNSSYELSVRKYFVTAYPIGAQAALGLLSPLGFIDLAWLYQPFMALLLAATALALNSLLARVLESRRLRALVSFVAAQPALVIAFALQGSIKEMTALATLSLTIALTALVIIERWPARAFITLALSSLATLGALGPLGIVYVGPPLLVAVGVAAFRLRDAPLRTTLVGAGGVLLAAVLLALPLVGGASTAVRANNTTLSPGEQLGNLAHPLDLLQATGAWVVGDYRYEPLSPHRTRAVAVLVLLAGLVGLVMAIRRRALGPLLVAGILVPLSGLLLLRGNPYADAKVLVLASIVVPLLAMLAAAWLITSGERLRRIAGAALAVGVAGAVLAGNVLAYHDVQLAPYDRYEEQLSIAEQLEGKGAVVFAEYDEFAKHFMRTTQVLSQPEWPFEFPIGPLNVKGAATHVEENLDGLHPTFKAPLDPDGITPSSLQKANFIVIRRSPTTSRPPANYRLIRRGRYYEVWQRDASERVLFHQPFGPSVFQPAARPKSCSLVKKVARKAERAGGELAWLERGPVSLYDPRYASEHNKGFGFDQRVTYPLWRKSVTVGGSGAAKSHITVSKTGRYDVWMMGSFGRETTVSIDGRPAGAVSYEIANSGAYMLLDQIKLTKGTHRLVVARGGGNLLPGNGGGYSSNLLYLGPVVLSPVEAQARTVQRSDPAGYRGLCSKRLDWVEAVKPVS